MSVFYVMVTAMEMLVLLMETVALALALEEAVLSVPLLSPLFVTARLAQEIANV